MVAKKSKLVSYDEMKKCRKLADWGISKEAKTNDEDTTDESDKSKT